MNTQSPRRPSRHRLMQLSRSKKGRVGAALVEFAVVAPLMILFTLGMIEIGRMTMVKQLIVNITREGAREATLPNANNADVKTSVNALLANSNISGATVNVTTDSFPGSTAQYATVSISVPSENVSWLQTPLFMGGKVVQGSTSMRKESL